MDDLSRARKVVGRPGSGEVAVRAPGIGNTLGDFAVAVKKYIPGAVIEIGPGDNFLGMPYPPHGVYDITRAQKEPGFKPEYNIDRGVQDYVASLERMRAAGL